MSMLRIHETDNVAVALGEGEAVGVMLLQA